MKDIIKSAMNAYADFVVSDPILPVATGISTAGITYFAAIAVGATVLAPYVVAAALLGVALGAIVVKYRKGSRMLLNTASVVAGVSTIVSVGNAWIAQGSPSITIQNNTTEPICAVYMVDAGSEYWGDDILPGGNKSFLPGIRTIQPGKERRWKVDEGYYSVLMDDCDQIPMGQKLNVPVFEAVLITLDHRDADLAAFYQNREDEAVADIIEPSQVEQGSQFGEGDYEQDWLVVPPCLENEEYQGPFTNAGPVCAEFEVFFNLLATFIPGDLYPAPRSRDSGSFQYTEEFANSGLSCTDNGYYSECQFEIIWDGAEGKYIVDEGPGITDGEFMTIYALKFPSESEAISQFNQTWFYTQCSIDFGDGRDSFDAAANSSSYNCGSSQFGEYVNSVRDEPGTLGRVLLVRDRQYVFFVVLQGVPAVFDPDELMSAVKAISEASMP